MSEQDSMTKEEESKAEFSAQFFIDLSRSSYNASTTYFDTAIRPQIERNERQYNGVFEESSKYSHRLFAKRSRIYKPATLNAVQKHMAAINEAYFSTQDVVTISAINEADLFQSASADYFQQVMNLRLTGQGKHAIPWYRLVLGTYEDCLVRSYCITRQNWGNGKPEINHIAPENFRILPASNWLDPISSSPFTIELIPMNVGDLREKIKTAGWIQVSDEQLMSARRNYSSSTRNARESGRPDPLESTSAVRDHDTVWVQLHIHRIKGQDMCWYTLGDDTLLSVPDALEEVFPGMGGQRPYVMGFSTIEAHKVFPRALPERVRPLVNELNDIVNKRLDNVEFALMKKYIIKRGQRVDHAALIGGPMAGAIELSDPQKDIKVLETVDVTQSAYVEGNQLSAEIDTTAGSFNGATVANNQAMNESVGGLSMLSAAAGQIGSFMIKTHAETWVEPVLRQILMLEQRFLNDQEVATIAATKANLVKKYGIQVVDERILLQQLSMRIAVGSSSTNPAAKLERIALTVGKVGQLGPQAVAQLDITEIVKEMFGVMGYKDGGKFIKADAPNPDVQALQQQLEQLQAALQQEQAKRKPEVEAAEVEERQASAMKIRAEAHAAAAQAAILIAEMPEITQAVDGMLSAASQPGMQYPTTTAFGRLSKETREKMRKIIAEKQRKTPGGMPPKESAEKEAAATQE